MIEKSDLSELKRNIETCIGKRVQLKSNKGRRNTFVKEGILESTYPNIFVVKLDNETEASRRVTYSYTDILTKTIELELCTVNNLNNVNLDMPI